MIEYATARSVIEQRTALAADVDRLRKQITLAVEQRNSQQESDLKAQLAIVESALRTYDTGIERGGKLDPAKLRQAVDFINAMPD